MNLADNMADGRLDDGMIWPKSSHNLDDFVKGWDEIRPKDRPAHGRGPGAGRPVRSASEMVARGERIDIE